MTAYNNMCLLYDHNACVIVTSYIRGVGEWLYLGHLVVNFDIGFLAVKSGRDLKAHDGE